MPRRNWSDGQEIVFEDFNAGMAARDRELYDRALREIVQRQADAFFGDSLLVEFATGTSVTIRPGLGIQEDLAQVSPEPNYRPIALSTSSNNPISSPDGSDDRIDIVCVKAAIVDELSQTRKFKDAIGGTVSNQSLVTQRDWQADIVIVSGTPDPSPVAPATPTGYIRIASLLVSAVSGLSGAGAVTDERILMPLGAGLLLNTLGYARLTPSATAALQDVIAEIDGYLENGVQSQTDYEELGSAPASPSTGFYRFYNRGGTFFAKDSFGVETPLGSGGGGGGLTWNPTLGSSPIESEENGEKVYLYEAAGAQKLTLFLKVPSSYSQGKQISLKLAHYSPATSGTMLLKTTSYLVRNDVDAVSSLANSYVSTNSAKTNTVADQYREASVDVTNATGQINGFSVQPGDLIRIELSRGTDTDTEDTRFIPSATEALFS